MTDDNDTDLDRQARGHDVLGTDTTDDPDGSAGPIGRARDALNEVMHGGRRDPAQGDDSGYNTADVSNVGVNRDDPAFDTGSADYSADSYARSGGGDRPDVEDEANAADLGAGERYSQGSM